MVTDAELTFWIVCGILCILAVCAIPFISNYLEYKETRRIFRHYDRTEYHDDMEDEEQ